MARLLPLFQLMTQSIPTIQEYMTRSAHSVGKDQSIAVATKLMAQHGIRHLPVLHGGQLVGILTDRDVKLIAAFDGADLFTWKVEEAMTGDPFTVAPTTPIDEVTNAMAEKKFGCAVVVQNHKVVGIFTTVDACAALTDLVRNRLR